MILIYKPRMIIKNKLLQHLFKGVVAQILNYMEVFNYEHNSINT